MKCTHIYSDPAGESHFEDVEVELKLVDFAPAASPPQVASPIATERLILLSVPPGYYGHWHPVPCRQFHVRGTAGARAAIVQLA